MNTRKHALIVAGGSGQRIGSPLPKQFVELNGKPLLMHTFHAFCKYDKGFDFVLVLPGREIETWKRLCEKHRFDIPHIVAAGGETRFHSVKNGLQQIPEEGVVFIHDGVRPLVSPQTIENCYLEALKNGNAIPVIPPAESIRQVIENHNYAMSRENLFLVQTPQVFRVSIIKKAYEQEYSKHFTDDASVLESTGSSIFLVEGNRENIKITWPSDFIISEALLKRGKAGS